MGVISWNFIVASDLFGAGMSAGALIASLIADFSGNRRYGRIVKIGAFIAPFPVSIGVSALIFDLERPLSFWKLYTSFQSSSIMSLGSWILLLFLSISAAIFYMYIPDRYDFLKIKSWITGGRLSKSIKVAGLILAFATATYTGVLLSVLVARPFWNTPLLPIVFLLSAVIDGIAAIGFVLYATLRHAGLQDELVSSKRFMGKFYITLLVLLFIRLSFLIIGFYRSTEYAPSALSVIMGGPLTVVFWLGFIVIGMLIPLIYGLFEILPSRSGAETTTPRPLLALLVPASILIGGFMLRYVVVYAGQITGPILQ